MLRKIGIALLFVGGLLTTNAFSTTNYIFTQGMAVEFEFPVNDPQIFSNIFFWTLKASCAILGQIPETAVSVKMLRKTGSVNGTDLTAGDEIGILLHTGDMLNITAESGAKVELVNRGTQTIKASCTTA